MKPAITKRNWWNYFAWGVLTFLIVFHGVNNFIVFQKDNIPFVHDAADVYLNAVHFLAGFPRGSVLSKIRLFYTSTSRVYPPLFAAVAAAMMGIFGASQDVALMANIPFLAVLLISTYLLGKELFDRETGLIAATLLAFFPATFSFSRALMVDFALVAMVTLLVLLLAHSNHTISLRISILLGLVLGLTALTKPSFSLFLIGPFIFLIGLPFISNIKNKKSTRFKKQLVNIMLAGLIATMLALPWYWTHVRMYMEEHRFFYDVIYTSKWSPSFYSNLLEFHLGWTLGRYLFPGVALLFGVSLIYYLLAHRKWKGLLFSWLATPYLFLILIYVGLSDGFMMLRHLVSTIPAVALILAVFLRDFVRHVSKACPQRLRGCAHFTFLLLIIEIPVFLAITYSGGGDLWAPFRMDVVDPGTIIRLNYLGRTSPHDIGFKIEEVSQMLMDEWQYRGAETTVFFLNRFGMVSDAVLTEMTAQSLLQSDITFTPTDCLQLNLTADRTSWSDEDSCRELFDSSDYAIIERIILEEWWVWDEEMYIDEIVPTTQWLKKDVTNYTLIAALPNRLAVSSEWAGVDPSFDWLNGSTWILKK